MTTQTLTQKVKVIRQGDGRSLEDLDINPGELVGIYEDYPRYARFFYLIRAGNGGLTEEWPNPGDFNKIYLRYFLNERGGRYYGLVKKGVIVKLSSPIETTEGNYGPDYDNNRLVRIPNLKIMTGRRDEPRNKVNVEFVNRLYVGEENIIQGLREIPDFDIYANWLQSEFERLKQGS